MNIRIRYFGQVAELTGTNEEIKNLDIGCDLNDIESEIRSKYELDNTYYRIALNQNITDNKETMLNDNDEVAFMPPFAGG
ncbi:MAG TPA: MoaD/ThiS family protein [Flavobacteriales bacterium]|nr:MoaD/ThiS family protein [Flavobacteriales bacterium]